MIVEATFISLLFLAWRKSGQGKGMNDDRRKVYENAMEHLSDTEKLRKLADQFEKYGCPTEASLMRRRADYRDLPQEKKNEYRELYQKAMTAQTLKDGSPMTPEFLEKLAYRYEAITAIGSAKNLRGRAKEIRQAHIEQKANEAKVKEMETKKAVEKSKKPETQVEVVSEIPADAKDAN